jgi:hypothetical protein
MRTGLALLISLWISACKFQSAPVPPVAEEPASAGRDGSGAATRDAGADAGESPADSGAPSTDAAADGGPFTRGDSGQDDAGALEDGSIPIDPEEPPQVGGLKCGDLFCPFATAPIEPCCTADEDVAHGAARDVDRCGLSFAATGSDYFADLCWQRDQPGVVDESCPAVSVDLRSEEPGCCNDRGQCGALNSDHALGCHADPYASAAQSCGAGVGGDDAGTVDACDMRGVYAVRMEVDMVWGGRSGGLWDLTDDGRGTLVIDMLLTLADVDDATLELDGTLRPCGVTLPTFYSTSLCEAYRPIFPTAMWESSEMPQFDISGQLSCLEPGCIASLEALNVLLGVELENPEAPWPTAEDTPDITCPSGEGMECFHDHDDDGRPGLTVQVAKQGTATGGTGCQRNGYDLRGAPLRSSVAAIFDGVRRTDRVLLGVRMRVGGSFALAGDACDSGRGSGVAEFVNSRAWSCLVERGTYNYPNGNPAGANSPCTAQEATFMDANLPVYHVLSPGEAPGSNFELADTAASAGPRVALVRLGGPEAAISCADVRAAMHP